MKDIEKIIGEVNGTMAVEGMPLTEQDKQRLRECITGKTSYDDMVKELVKKHTARPAR